jgi:hypothetical protein
MKKIEIIKDVPGANIGDIFEIHEESTIKTGTNQKFVRGCSINGKYWFDDEILKYPEFFKVIE